MPRTHGAGSRQQIDKFRFKSSAECLALDRRRHLTRCFTEPAVGASCGAHFCRGPSRLPADQRLSLFHHALADARISGGYGDIPMARAELPARLPGSLPKFRHPQPGNGHELTLASQWFQSMRAARTGRPDAYTPNELPRRAGKHDRRHFRGFAGAESTVGSAIRTNAPEDSRSRGRRASTDSATGIRPPRSVARQFQIQKLALLHRDE